MSKQNLKIVYAGLGIVNLLCLFVLSHANTNYGSISFTELTRLDSYLWLLPLMSIVAVAMALARDTVAKVFPIVGIIIYCLYFILLLFISARFVGLSPSIGFYITIIIDVLMVMVSMMYKKAV